MENSICISSKYKRLTIIASTKEREIKIAIPLLFPFFHPLTNRKQNKTDQQ
jgi:hypothetical protein